VSETNPLSVWYPSRNEQSTDILSDIVNPLNAELNPICHLLALLGAHHIFHVSRIRVNSVQHNWLLIIIKYQQFLLCMCKLLVFRRVRRIAKGDYYFHYVPLSVCLSFPPALPPSARNNSVNIRGNFENLSRKFKFH